MSDLLWREEAGRQVLSFNATSQDTNFATTPRSNRLKTRTRRGVRMHAMLNCLEFWSATTWSVTNCLKRDNEGRLTMSNNNKKSDYVSLLESAMAMLLQHHQAKNLFALRDAVEGTEKALVELQFVYGTLQAGRHYFDFDGLRSWSPNVITMLEEHNDPAEVRRLIRLTQQQLRQLKATISLWNCLHNYYDAFNNSGGYGGFGGFGGGGGGAFAL
jgi:hypothetical protein